MRFWVLLLAVYVLVLSGVPCEALCQDEPTTAAAQRTDSPAEQEDCKSCSPFSLCATGSGFTLPVPVLTWSPAPALPALTVIGVPRYRASHMLEVSARIWQPPRLA